MSCASLSGNSQDACTKALQASFKQSGVEQNVDKIESNVSKMADTQARSWVGDSGMTTGAVIGGTGKAIVDKSANLKFPAFVPGMFVNLQLGASKSMAGIEWKY